jgi:acyl-CoA synthetase (AMP-forming)/AMP-acid ligase II
VCLRVVGEDGVEVAVGERGLVEVKSPTQTAGYWRRPELDAEAFRDGFFRTGDLGFLDADGYLNVVGRASEALSSGAHPREVEEAAHRHPGLKECALVELGGESVLACSARRGRELYAGALRRLLAERLADAEVPGRVEVLAGDLPRSGAGKVLRAEVRRTLEHRETA